MILGHKFHTFDTLLTRRNIQKSERDVLWHLWASWPPHRRLQYAEVVASREIAKVPSRKAMVSGVDHGNNFGFCFKSTEKYFDQKTE